MTAKNASTLKKFTESIISAKTVQENLVNAWVRFNEAHLNAFRPISTYFVRLQ